MYIYIYIYICRSTYRDDLRWPWYEKKPESLA